MIIFHFLDSQPFQNDVGGFRWSTFLRPSHFSSKQKTIKNWRENEGLGKRWKNTKHFFLLYFPKLFDEIWVFATMHKTFIFTRENEDFEKTLLKIQKNYSLFVFFSTNLENGKENTKKL